MDFIKDLITVVIGIFAAYVLIRRLSGQKEKSFYKKYFKYLVLLFIAAVCFDLLITFLTKKPELVNSIRDQLEVDPEILRIVGKYNGFGYNKNEINSLTSLPDTINFSIFGNKAEVELKVVIDSSQGIYEVKHYDILEVNK